MKHLNNSLLNNCQQGFHRGLSCVAQLTELTHDPSSALYDKGGTVDCIFLDFQKAFDVVHYDTIIEKLSWYGIETTMIRWIKNYL